MSTEIKLEGAAGSRDENKITTFTVPYYVESFAEVTTVGKVVHNGLGESTRSWQAWNAGEDGWVVTVVYKGHLQGDVDADADYPEKTEQWSMDFDFSEEPLQSHPDIEEIKTDYGGYTLDNELRFPEFMPSNNKAGGGLSKKMRFAGDPNPLFGTTTYAVMTARVTRSWSARKIPKNAVNDIGKTYKNIPDAPDDIEQVEFGDRNWLAMPPKISQNGNVWRIENEWLLSPEGGWIEEIYKEAEK